MDQRPVVSHKLVLLGDTSVGKSCLVVRFCRGEFYDYQEPTSESVSLWLSAYVQLCADSLNNASTSAAYPCPVPQLAVRCRRAAKKRACAARGQPPRVRPVARHRGSRTNRRAPPPLTPQPRS